MQKPSLGQFWCPLAGGDYLRNQALFDDNNVRWSYRHVIKRSLTLAVSYALQGRVKREIDRFASRIADVRIEQGPIFIIGHWRSGTTFLHNLMAQDVQFAFLTLGQSIAPEQFITPFRTGSFFLRNFTPKERPSDRVRLGSTLPQEDELAMCNLTHMSCYHGLYFPATGNKYMNAYLRIDELSEVEQVHWKTRLDYLYRKLTFYYRGRTLILKNPPHTARIAQLKRMYPTAKFVYLLRDPHAVYHSSRAFMPDLIKRLAFQCWDDTGGDEILRQNYLQLLDKVEQESADLPGEDWVALRYEDLVLDPLAAVQRIYEQLQLASWDEAQPRLQTYLAEAYRPHQKTYPDPKQDPSWIEKEWVPLYQRHLKLIT